MKELTVMYRLAWRIKDTDIKGYGNPVYFNLSDVIEMSARLNNEFRGDILFTPDIIYVSIISDDVDKELPTEEQ